MKNFDQIVARAKKTGFTVDPNWLCLICGKKFSHNACTHTVEENEEVLEIIKEKIKI